MLVLEHLIKWVWTQQHKASVLVSTLWVWSATHMYIQYWHEQAYLAPTMMTIVSVKGDVPNNVCTWWVHSTKYYKLSNTKSWHWFLEEFPLKSCFHCQKTPTGGRGFARHCSSVTASVGALITCCFAIICAFAFTTVWMGSDSLPSQAFFWVVIWDVFSDGKPLENQVIHTWYKRWTRTSHGGWMHLADDCKAGDWSSCLVYHQRFLLTFYSFF